MSQVVKKDPLMEIKMELMKNASRYKSALPPHITPEKFFSVVSTALSQNLDLLSLDRQSLFTSALKCAADGLLPDGREAAFVKFGSKVQYMPMVQGIIKKVRNSGELKTIGAHVVYENEKYTYRITQNGEEFEHTPMLVGDKGKPLFTYAIATTKDGGFYIEVMSETEIQAVRNVSKAKDNGPWSGPFIDEMKKKSAIRRLSKRLPMSTDVSQVIERDDEMIDFEPEKKNLPSSGSQEFSFESFGSPIEVESNPVQEKKDEEPKEWELEAAKDPRIVK